MLLYLNLKLVLPNIRMKGKTDVNLKSLFCFSLDIKQQINNIVASQKTMKESKKFYIWYL